MPAVPPPCQPIADSVAALDAQEQQLRAGLASSVGAAAWAALAQLGQVRQQLADGRVALAKCVGQNSAGLQATLAVIDVDPASAVLARIAALWELAPSGVAIQREVSTVSGDTFAFAGPLPASFGVTVGTASTAGDPTISGPDFRSAALSAASLPTDGPLRVEVVVGPTVRLEQSDLARVTAAFTPTTSRLLGSSGPFLPTNATLNVRGVDARLSDSGIVARAFGTVAITTFGIAGSGTFEANATVRAVPTNLPGVADLVDVVTVSDLLFPGSPSAMQDSPVLPLIRGYLADLLTDQLRDVLRAELPAAVLRTLVLPALPPDVVMSVRKLSIDASALQFQPVLGAIGTTLSTFAPPPIPQP